MIRANRKAIKFRLSSRLKVWQIFRKLISQYFIAVWKKATETKSLFPDRRLPGKSNAMDKVPCPCIHATSVRWHIYFNYFIIAFIKRMKLNLFLWNIIMTAMIAIFQMTDTAYSSLWSLYLSCAERSQQNDKKKWGSEVALWKEKDCKELASIMDELFFFLFYSDLQCTFCQSSLIRLLFFFSQME